MLLEENPKARILVVSDYLGPHENAEGKALASYPRDLLLGAFLRAGISSEDYALCSIYGDMPFGNKVSNINFEIFAQGVTQLQEHINKSKYNLIVPLGSKALKVLTGHDSINKYHLSVLTSGVEFGSRKVIPLIHPRDVMKSYTDSAYISFGALRIKEEASSSSISIPKRIFLLNPTFDDTMEFLDFCLYAPDISVDLETGRGQINTVGFSISPTEAIAINVLPDRLGPDKFYALWDKIRQVCESPVPKIAQNALYEFMWLSRYGIRLENVVHDTMWCQKFLHPELRAGLDNVGRLYTPFPYWKDDNESWNDIRDWNRHYDYNCKDTTGTHWAYREQIKDLKEQELYDLYTGFVQRFFGPITEMCSRGLLVETGTLARYREEAQRKLSAVEAEINKIFLEQTSKTINVGSEKQLKAILKEMGFKIPVSKGKESTDRKSLAKLRKKHPKEDVFSLLTQRSGTQKLISSYLSFSLGEDKKLRYGFNGCATETGRWNSTKDAFGNGFNAQTVPKYVRNIFIAEPGKVLMEVDLAQAESRYVAWEAPEPKLMELLNDGRDIHRYVASRIFGKPERDITGSERQLGKKSGHAANYGVGPRTFSESCLLDGIDISESESRRVIEGYYEVFPGIRKRQADIRRLVSQKRFLQTPLGRKRFFYDRVGDPMFREAYAYCPQSTIPDITNHLMLFLWADTEIEFLLQVHDSLLLQVPQEKINLVAEYSRSLESWHPEIHLAGGKLEIPVDIKVGECWGSLHGI